MSAPLPAPRELLARSDSGARYSAVLPATTTRVTLTASDATTVRPRVAERDRLRCATNPGMPNSLPAMPSFTRPTSGACDGADRSARFERRTSCVWRMASTAETRAARADGTQALTSKVAIDSAAAAANAPASTCTASPADPDPNIAANASCDDENAPAVPATPAKRPIGTPTAPSSSASASTVLRSCRFEAPREASSPNCRVRSATEMANAL
jgi:hypothetical protein